MKILIKNAMILTMKQNQEIVEGDILIADDRIIDIRKHIHVQADEVIQANGMVAMPGLINTHQHSPMSLLRGFSDDLKLMDWLKKKMLPAEANMTPEDIYWGSKLSMAEMIKSGTTAFADMYIEMDQIAQAVTEVGMRASLTRGLVF
ncbi:S-adenosylhomocysteine deaminase [Halalkalibacter wakoensis JCM 9140]|uniref:S-adenosylhomocysteine deaminase n=1 Tax=Halalkalibacter wakoensis JCM 9140 TaxID=1236970 RepID=W4PZL5_9BACI|nr:S-adenosylhomocysteine deaminase [Halalkalibacter wakoensis JCM 9140]